MLHNYLAVTLHSPYIFGLLGRNRKPLFLGRRGCCPIVCIHAVCGVYIKILPSIVMYFCSNVLGSLTFVAIRTVFQATCGMGFFYVGVHFILCSLLLMPLFSLSEYLVSTPVLLFDHIDFHPFKDKSEGSGRFFNGRFVILTSNSDEHWRSCIISGWSGGYIKFFQSKQACLNFSQFRLFDHLVVATFDSKVLGFRRMCASKWEIFVALCGINPRVFMISAMSEANLYRVFYRLFA